MTAILVLGIGNPLLGDDGFGVEVVRRLRQAGSLPPAAELLDGGTAGLALLPHLEGRSQILVVDAVDFGGRPGEIVRLPAAAVPACADMKLSEHQVTFREVLGLMELLEVKPQEMLFIGVQPRSNRWGDALSPDVEAAIPAVLDEIGRQLASWS